MKNSLKFIYPVYLFMGVSILFQACKKENPEPEPAQPLTYSEMKDVSYGPHERHTMDVYLPANRNSQTKVVVAIHGGGFVVGNKEDLAVPVAELVAKGYAVVNINYRLVDTTGIFQDPIVHQPSAVTIAEQLEDIRLAVDFAVDKVAEWTVSSDKWAMFGHSAGATLALLYVHGSTNADGQIKVVGNLAGAVDFSFQDESEFDQLDPKLVEVLYRAIGAEPTNENKLAYMAKSPYWVTYNKSNPEPVINILPENNTTGGGSANDQQLYTTYTDLLNNKQVPNQYTIVAGADHGFSQPGKWEEAAGLLDDFFGQHLM